MFEGALPPLLRAELDPASEAWKSGIEMASWEPLWKTGEHPPSRVRAFPAGKLMLFDGERPTGVNIPIVAYAIRSGALTVTVDAGLGSRMREGYTAPGPAEGPVAGMRYRPVLEGPSFAEQLDAEGIRPDRAICTHLHLDHAGGARDLGLAVEAAPAEIAAAVADDGGEYPPEDVAGLALKPLDTAGGPVGSFTGHGWLAPGLLLVESPGHTAGSVSVFACLGGAWALICGDAVYPLADEPGSPAFKGMLRIRRALDEVGGMMVLPGHDTSVLRACADGAWLGTDGAP